MKTVYKYDLYPEGRIDLPVNAQILTVQVQRYRPYIWALVDTDEPVKRRQFYLYGTGHPINEPR